MRKIVLKLLSVTLCLAILAGFALIMPFSVSAAEFYKDYTTVKVVKNQLDCYSMQGCDSDDTYIYCTKIKGTEDKAIICRVNKNGEQAVELMTNGDTGTQYFTQLAHSNDLDVADVNGVKTMFVATGSAGTGDYSLVRFAISGKTLTQVGHYNVKYNDASTYLASAQVMSVEGDQIKLICKRSKYIYTATIGVNQTSGDVKLTSLCTLDLANTIINSQTKDISTWVQQGFEYYDGKIYVPMTGPEGLTDQSCIIAYPVVGVSGTVRNDPNWSIHITSATYADLFEIESCTICPTDGKMYISTNRRKTSSDADHDGVHVIQKFVYDPTLGDSAQTGNYRWVTQNNQLLSVTDGGATYNHAQIITGTVSDSKVAGGRYSLDQAVVLKHSDPWIIQWTGSAVTGHSLLLSSSKKSAYAGNTYLYTRKDGLIALGNFDGSQYSNYGINIADHGLTTSAKHTYRLENRISSDGSNMVYLIVDGKELGAMNNYFLGSNPQNTTSTWISGKDFSFSYLGTDPHTLNSTLSEIAIWGQGIPRQVDEPNTYRWETKNNAMTAISGVGYTANTVTQLYGSCADNVYKDYQGELTQDLVLLHNRPWSVEWKTSTGINSAMLLASAAYSKTVNAPLLQFGSTLVFGAYDGSSFQKTGVDLTTYGIDIATAHTYRLTNRVSTDGTNMVYLFVDGKEIAPMNSYYIGGTAQGTTSDWLNGRDLTFSYLGTYQNDINGALEYLQVWEAGIPAQIGGISYRWTPGTNTLNSSTTLPYHSNNVTALGGSNTTTFNNSWFRLEKPVVLLHDRNWTLQWESEGSWKGSANGAMLLAASQLKNEVNAPYLYRRSNSDLIAFGVRADGNHHNYGVSLSAHGIDGTAKHIYTLTNKVNTDGSNMIYLSVDGVELGAMNSYFLGGTAQNTTNNWVSGKDFVFSYIGTPDFPLGNCNLTYLQVDNVCDHSYSDWTVTKAATCTKSGNRTCLCPLCGDTKSEIIPATGHSYSAVVTIPTCTEAGYTTYTCQACGDSYTAGNVAALGHSYETVTIDATCAADGSITDTCTACGDVQIEVIPATGHTHEAVVTAPTCTEDGYTTYICHCGDSYVSDNVTAPGHNCEIVTVAATCEKDGSITETCTVCGDVQVTVIPAAGHSYEGVTTDPTCIESGYTIFTCGNCGHSYKDRITNPVGHSYETAVIAPSCTEAGYTTYTCHCGDSYIAGNVTALGHSFADGICGTCGEADPGYVKPVVVPTLALKAPALEFKDMIKVIAFFTVDNTEDVAEMGMITYTEQVDVVDINTAAHVIPGADFEESSGRYFSSSQGIHAKYLGDTVYLACYAKLTDGSYVYTKLASYSPITYATNQLKNSTNMELKQLCAAMLNYGAAAQNYFQYNTDVLANSTLTDEQITLPESYRADMIASVPAADAAKQGIFANNKGFSVRKPAVSFEGAFSINYFFTPAYTPADGITLYYWSAADFAVADVLTVENASGSIDMIPENGQYRADLEGIAAKNLSDAVYVAAIYSDGTTTWTSGVLGYSIGAYCSSQATKGGTMADLAMATAVYGYHAKAYFG